VAGSVSRTPLSARVIAPIALRRVRAVRGDAPTALRCQDIFAVGADRWSDPRARLLEGAASELTRPRLLEFLELESEPAGCLAELASALEGAHSWVLDGLGGNIVLMAGCRSKARLDGGTPADEGVPRPDRRDAAAG
jgi:hypothetical protein